MALVSLGVPVFIVLEAVAFHQEAKLITATDWMMAEYIKYPNITICDPKFFSLKRMKGMLKHHN